MGTLTMIGLSRVGWLLSYMSRDKAFNSAEMPRVLDSWATNTTLATVRRDFARDRRVWGVDSARQQGKGMVFSWGRDELNPDDPEDIDKGRRVIELFNERVFQGAVACAGVRQADGKGRMGHGHEALSNVVLRDVTINGKTLKAGQALGGDALDLKFLRRVFDECCAEVGVKQWNLSFEYGDRRSFEDKAARRAGKKTKPDQIKDIIEDALVEQPETLDEFEYELAARGVELRIQTRVSGKYAGQTRFAYRLTGDAAWITEKRLGLERYGHDEIMLALEHPGTHTPRTVNPPAGPEKPVRALTPVEIAEAAQVTADLAARGAEIRRDRDERAAQEQLAEEILAFMRTDDPIFAAQLDEVDRLLAEGRDFEAGMVRDDIRYIPSDDPVLQQIIEMQDVPTSAPAPVVGLASDPAAAQPTEPIEGLPSSTPAPDGNGVESRDDESTPVSAPASTIASQQDAPETFEETYARLFGGAGTPSAPAPGDGQESAPAPAMPIMEVIDEAPLVSAPAATEEVPTAAPAPVTTTEEPYVSPLRTVKFKKDDPARDKLRDDLAAFDEETRVRLAEGQRPVDAHVPKGVGRQVLKVWGPYLDPDVFDQLTMRETKKHEARVVLWAEAKDTSEKMAALRAKGKLVDRRVQGAGGQEQGGRRAPQEAPRRDRRRHLRGRRDQAHQRRTEAQGCWHDAASDARQAARRRPAGVKDYPSRPQAPRDLHRRSVIVDFGIVGPEPFQQGRVARLAILVIGG